MRAAADSTDEKHKRLMPYSCWAPRNRPKETVGVRQYEGLRRMAINLSSALHRPLLDPMTKQPAQPPTPR